MASQVNAHPPIVQRLPYTPGIHRIWAALARLLRPTPGRADDSGYWEAVARGM